ncbi:MAG: MMPL family transporter, partial [Steroidobacteraceae bacterium]
MSRAVFAGTIWVLCAGIAIVIVLHTHYSTDLSAFLPRRATATQRLLVEQLNAGPAAHLVIAGISGGDPAMRAEVSRYMAQRLRTNPSFIAIDNGDEAQLQRDRAFLFEHR